MTELLAFSVNADASDYSEVFFAPDEGDAWKQWAFLNCDVDVCSPDSCEDEHNGQVSREPYLDRFAETGVIPMNGYMAAGWSWVCSDCGYDAMPGNWSVLDGLAVCSDCFPPTHDAKPEAGE